MTLLGRLAVVCGSLALASACTTPPGGQAMQAPRVTVASPPLVSATTPSGTLNTAASSMPFQSRNSLPAGAVGQGPVVHP